MRRRAAKSLVLAGSLALLSGCVGGNFLVNNSSVKIRSTPEGALATSEYGDSCTTPCSLRLRTSRGGTIRISKEGYEDAVVSIGTHFDDVGAAMAAVGTAVNPDPFALAVEGFFTLTDAEGQYRKLDTRHVTVALRPLGAARPQEIQNARAAAETGGAGMVARLNPEEVEAIVGRPLSSETRTNGQAPGGAR